MHTRRSFLRTSLAAATAILADVSNIAAKERPAVSKSTANEYTSGASSLSTGRLCFIHSVYSEFVFNPTRGWLPIRMHMFNLFARST